MRIQRVPFLDVFKDASSGNVKTPQNEFLDEGAIPVVDQGQKLVAGYVNDKARICKATPPVIVFGDHTRAIKYVDFEFAMGADGTKVLVPKIEAYPKFLFYVLRAIDLPNAGYSRHFKFLKEIEIPLPPLAEQKRIARILDQADALRPKRRETIKQLDTLVQSVFLDMFGDPVTNPKGWDAALLSEIVDSTDTINYGVVQPGDDVPGGKPLVRVGDFLSGELSIDNLKRIDPAIEKRYSRSRLKGNELLVSCVGSIGRVCKIYPRHAGFNIARAVARVPLSSSVHRDFVLWNLRMDSVQRYFTQETRTVSQPTLNIGTIKSTPIVLPPPHVQQKFAKAVERIGSGIRESRDYQAQLDNLFSSLQSRAFKGEL